jgi:lipopolysaccharide biosynthesis glycosyltransferase
VLNLVLRNRWTELSPVWNWQFTAVTRFHMQAAEPRLVHFIGKNKPWHDVGANTPASFRRVYRQFQRQHYVLRPEICSADPATMCWPERPVWSFLKHALNVRRMHGYLSRFESDFATLPQ